MKPLIWGVANDFSRSVFTSLLHELYRDDSVDSAVVLYAGAEEGNGALSAESVYYSDFFKRMGRYPDYSRYEVFGNLLPIDAVLLEKLAPFEQEILKMMDRLNVRSYEERWRIYMEHLRFWNTALDYWKIDLFVHSLIPHEVVDYIVYALCKAKGIPFIGVAYSFFQGSCFMIDDIYEEFRELKRELSRLQARGGLDEAEMSEEARAAFHTCCSQINGQEMRFDFKEAMKSLSRMAAWKKSFYVIKSRTRFLLWGLHHLFSFDTTTFVSWRSYDNSDLFRENCILEKYYDSKCSAVDMNEPFVYVPLNTQPELSTSPCGGRYVDLLLYIEMLAFYLPKGWKLYVKEHPLMQVSNQVYTNSRSDLFYDRILRLKNVKLISPHENTFALIASARAIAVVTGSAGMEGFFLGKPILVFGRVFLEAAPKAYIIRRNEDCEHAMMDLAQGCAAKADENDVRMFLQAMFNSQVSSNMVEVFRDPSKTDADSAKTMAKAYMEMIEQIYGKRIVEKD